MESHLDSGSGGSLLTGRLAFALLAPLGLLLVLSQPASADANSSCGRTGAGRGASDWYTCASSPSIPAGLPSLRSNTVRPTVDRHETPIVATGSEPPTGYCTTSNTDPVDGTVHPASRAGAGRWVFTYCGDSGQPGGWSWVPTAVGAVVFASPAQLARQAYARLTPQAVVPDYNPRHRAGSVDGTVVGFTTWLWLDGQTLTAKTATAAAGPNRATVTARPSLVSFDSGDGSAAVVCDGGGKTWDPRQPDAVSDCVHRYLRSSGAAPGGVFVLTARVTWTATWAGSGGTGGVLPALTVTAATPVRVDELQAVNE